MKSFKDHIKDRITIAHNIEQVIDDIARRYGAKKDPGEGLLSYTFQNDKNRKAYDRCHTKLTEKFGVADPISHLDLHHGCTWQHGPYEIILRHWDVNFTSVEYWDTDGL